MVDKKIVIIGAGPTGLGAAWRLNEFGYQNWLCYEQHAYPGGLAASFCNEQGFWWDIGGHVLFSHYDYFNTAFETVMHGDYLEHQRSSWIRVADTFVPYPFQNNIRYLPQTLLEKCLEGLIRVSRQTKKKPAHFKEWCEMIFGEGITRLFMAPYNRKVWGYPLELLSPDWIAERISIIDLARIRENIDKQQDDTGWGPNNTFKFPLRGATGEIFRRIAERCRLKIQYNKELVEIDALGKKLRFSDGTIDEYDFLISSIPLTLMVKIIKPQEIELLRASEESLVATSGVIVGLGFKGTPPENNRCWMYFPESTSPFYRITYFHHYSPHNVPDGAHYSYMCETSYSPYRPINKSSIIEDTITGLIRSGIISEDERHNIISTFVIDVPFSYPAPTLKRNNGLSRIIRQLEQHCIFSRGRFGLWLYEVGNMDHSFQQGADIVNRLVLSEKEQVIAPFRKIVCGEP